MKLILFDLDETLIKGFEGHKTAFSEAFRKVYGVDTNVDIINNSGMTQRGIIIEVLKKNGLTEEVIKPRIEECLKVMDESFEEIIKYDEIIVLEGVRELLEELEKNNILMGLVTGNSEFIARSKLKKVGLDKYFKVGGFGSEEVDRTKLVKIAIQKAGEGFGFKFNDDVFIFGDTPRDVKAGKEAGVKTVCVCTGIYSEGQLEETGADFVLPDLRDKQKILKIIL